MSIYLPPSMLNFVPRHMTFSTWTDHLPFAYDLVAEIRPTAIVELGAYSGLSFFCFCQAMVEHDVKGKCYAIDTWRGDDHTGPYDEHIYEEVLRHKEQYYHSIAQFMRMTFANAVTQFRDESIDLLHIDGLHTYEAVKVDFETWYPKVAPGGIVLFHDICARDAGFGVWKLWNEMSPHFETFEFKQGFGLGVLRKPGSAVADGPLIRLLFGGSPQQRSDLRSLYAYAAYHVMLRRWGAKRREKAGNSKMRSMASTAAT